MAALVTGVARAIEAPVRVGIRCPSFGSPFGTLTPAANCSRQRPRLQGVWSGQRDPPGLLSKGLTMSDKSPRQALSKKTGKSLKEKRAEKRSKGTESSGIETTLHGKKR